MSRINQFIRVEEDGGGITSIQVVTQPKVTIPKPSVRSSNITKNLSDPSNYVAHSFRVFQTVFKEPIYKVMDKIKRKPFFFFATKTAKKHGHEGSKASMLLPQR